MKRCLQATTVVLLGLGVLAGYGVTTGADPCAPLSASLTVHDTVLGQTTTYIGATEAGVFFMDDLTDLGINTYRLWTKMAELEWWDDDDARAATPWMCTEVGTPSIEDIKADQASGFANTIPWDWWDEQFTGTYYTWSGHSREEVIQQCVDSGITPVLVLRNRDDGNQPDACGGAWAPDSPIEQADLNEWWEHCFAIAYWLNVLHNYGVTRFEVLNEPDLAGQGWHGTQAEYVQLIQTAYDAVQFANDMAGIDTVIHAPVVSNPSSPYMAYSLDNADDEITVVDYHTYADDPSASLATVKATIAAHNPDGVTEPIWVSEWGTYTSSYDTFARAMLTAQQLLTFSKEEVEGVTLFGMYDWGGFDGLLDTDRARSETYYAYRLMTRGLKGGKERLDYSASGVSGELMVTRDAEHVYIIVINGDATIDADLSALGLGEGEVKVYEYSNSHKDAVVATPAMAGGQFSFSAPASGVVLAEVTPPPLAVELASFSAMPGIDHIVVQWETVSEVDTLGFNLYRSQAHDGEYVQLNGALIRSPSPGSPEGRMYTWLDTGVDPGTTYYYSLEEVNVHGHSTLHGPVWAAIDAAYRCYLPLVARPPCPVPLVQRQRYGFVATAYNWPLRFDYPDLRAGWYVQAAQGGYDTLPESMDRALLIGVYTGYTVDPAWLGPLVDDNPGIIWLVGNEPDCIHQNDVWPEEYARIYHDVYTFIKGRDRMSLVSPGGIVQPTLLRLEYLDRVLAEYQALYGMPMPVDVWNIHNAILDELRGGTGADIPPGFPGVQEGARRDPQDNDNMDIFTGQIRDFRQWMADSGYGGYPLIITEYGILMPEQWYGFTPERVGAFMSATFDILENTTDAALGDPTDSNRLVQRWAWFSLDVPPFEWPTTTQGFNGNLFDPETTAITAHGENYASHTSTFSPLAYVDLGISAWNVLPTTDLAGPTETISRSVQVRVANAGTADSGSFDVTVGYDGPLSGTLQQTVGTLPPVSSQQLHFTLADLQLGGYSLTVRVDPDDEVIESRECNNLVTGTVLAATDRLYLPAAARLGRGASSSPAPGQTDSEPQALVRVRLSDVVPGFQEFQVPTPSGYPVQIALDDQGAVWITEREGNKIARFDPQTQTWTEYDIPTPDSKPWGLALDGAGNVWFAETEADQIGKLIVASGTFSEYQTLTGDSQPWDITIGDDGMVWFTEKNADQIGKLVPSTGAMTEYPLPTSGAQPASIASRGIHVWFSEPGADKIGRLKTLDGSIYEFNPPTVDSVPQDIVLSPGGDPWFTEMAADQIALFHVSTLGLFWEFPVRTPNSEPFGIALEGNVAVWFTEKAADKLGRFSGPLPPKEYWLPSPNSQPTDVVVDSDGCAWYTAPGVNRIGRLCLPVRYSVHLPLVRRDHPSLGAER